jgi:hypothetical protein
MPNLEVADRTYRELELLAVAWHTTIAETVDRLIIMLAARATVGVTPEPVAVPVHAYYEGRRIEATFDHETHVVTMTSGPLRGSAFASPVDAEDAVCAVLRPDTAAEAGWTAWRITASNVPLDLLAGYRLHGLAAVVSPSTPRTDS